MVLSLCPFIAKRLAKVCLKGLPGNSLQFGGFDGRQKHASIEIARIQMSAQGLTGKYPRGTLTGGETPQDCLGFFIQKNILDLPRLGVGQGYYACPKSTLVHRKENNSVFRSPVKIANRAHGA